MKLIIAGSRTISLTPDTIADILTHFGVDEITEVVSGTAGGMDKAGEAFASSYDLPVKRFPADWDKLGKAAGHIRNAAMAKHGDSLLLIWDGSSRGSANMKKEMLGKPIYEVILKVTK